MPSSFWRGSSLRWWVPLSLLLFPSALLAPRWRISPLKLPEELKGKRDETMEYRASAEVFLREGEFPFYGGWNPADGVRFFTPTPFGPVTIGTGGKIHFYPSQRVAVEILSPSPGVWKEGTPVQVPFLYLRGDRRVEPSLKGYRELAFYPASGEGRGLLKAYSNGLELAWEFPSGKGKGVLLQFSGVVPERVDRKGNLSLRGEGIRFLLPPPRAFPQKEEGEVPARYRIEGNRFWVEVLTPPDTPWTLLIPLPPPENIPFAPKAFTWDTQGKVSLLLDYPTSSGDTDLFLVTFRPPNTLPLWLALIGGSGEDSGSSFAFDRRGNLIATGKTLSPDFPTTAGALSRSCGGDGRCGSSKGRIQSDAFLIQVSLRGELLYSTYFGGSGEDLGNTLAITRENRILLGGSTTSPDLPAKEKGWDPLCGTDGACGGKGGAPLMDGFLALFNEQGRLLATTYLGGSGEDLISSLALDPQGKIVIGGSTLSPDFPVTPGAYDPSCGSDGNCDGGKGDGFVAKIDPDLKTLLYGSFVGGEKEDAVEEVGVLSGRILLSGVTRSPGFPSEGIRQESGIEGWYLFRMGITPAYMVEVKVEGDGSVASTPSGILCGSQCGSPFLEGTAIEFTPVPGRNARFRGWEGEEVCQKGKFVVDRPITCKARFIKLPRTLTLVVEGEKGNTLRVLPLGITCPPQCIVEIPADTLLTIIPEPEPSSRFELWKGDPDCEDGRVLLDENRRCIAVFRKKSE